MIITMRTLRNRWTLVLALCSLLGSGLVGATACTGVNVGTSDTGDVTLDSDAATQCEIVAGNSGQGGGDSSLIPTDGSFGGGSWLQVGAEGGIVDSGPVSGLTFTSFPFTGTGDFNGMWGLGWTGGPGGLDVLFSMHAGGISGFFVLDGLTAPADSSFSGDWRINWFNSSGKNPGNESNVQFG